jgi:hypothetical protein
MNGTAQEEAIKEIMDLLLECRRQLNYLGRPKFYDSGSTKAKRRYVNYQRLILESKLHILEYIERESLGEYNGPLYDHKYHQRMYNSLDTMYCKKDGNTYQTMGFEQDKNPFLYYH